MCTNIPIYSFQSLTLSHSMMYASKIDVTAYNVAKSSVNQHRRFVITAVVLCALVSIVGIVSFLAASGHLPYALNALYVLNSVPPGASIALMVIGPVAAILIVRAQRSRLQKLNEKVVTANNTLYANLIENVKNIIISNIEADQNDPQLDGQSACRVPRSFKLLDDRNGTVYDFISLWDNTQGKYYLYQTIVVCKLLNPTEIAMLSPAPPAPYPT